MLRCYQKDEFFVNHIHSNPIGKRMESRGFWRKNMTTTKGLKILVVDDNENHRKAALAQLGAQNELTVASSYIEAEELINKGWNSDERKLNNHPFDMVLVDLLMPAPSTNQGSKGQKFVGQEMPIGIFLVILAAKFGAKYVGLYTDMNHHDHPASACLDGIGIGGSIPKIGEAKFTISSRTACFKDDFITKSEFFEWGEGDGLKPGFVEAKNWGEMADELSE